MIVWVYVKCVPSDSAARQAQRGEDRSAAVGGRVPGEGPADVDAERRLPPDAAASAEARGRTSPGK